MPVLYRIIAVAAVLGALLGSGAYIMHLRGELTTQREATRMAQEALKRTQATLALREKQRAASAQEAATVRASLGAALMSNRAWAEAPVPQEVQDELCKRIRCAGAIPDGVRSSSATNVSP